MSSENSSKAPTSINPGVFRTLLILGVLATSSVARAEDVNSDLGFRELYTATWNTHDADALAALFTADADIIMGNLPRIEGREAIGRWWQTYFSRIDAGRKGEFELLSDRAISPGVRLINVVSRTSGASDSGEKLEVRIARGTWVIVKRGESWLIAAMRGLPAEGEQRLRPGTDR